MTDRIAPTPTAILLLLWIPFMAGDPSHAQSTDPTFRIEPVRPIEEVQARAMMSLPPVEEGDFLAPDLVDLMQFERSLRFDIRYATQNNFMGTILYPQARAFLQRPAAEALGEAARELRDRGFGIIVYDAYRPWFVTKTFWDATPDSLKHFVADPATGSRHNRGAAVDVGLYDLASGDVAEMPSGYDEFTERAYPEYEGGTETARRNRELLRAAMERQGFTVYQYEWWHFDFGDWRRYPIMNEPFEALD